MQPTKVTKQIEEKVFKLLEEYPEGLNWSELRRKVEASDPSFHPKTVNGIIWKLPQKYPDKVHKPSKGLFRLQKHKT